MKKAGVILANGFEEIEAITPIDTLRRAGVEVVTIGVGSEYITGSHNVTIKCDTVIEHFNTNLDCIIIPGGMPGAKNISESELVIKLIDKIYKANGIVAAICASPGIVLGGSDIIKNKNFTCYPGYESYVKEGNFSNKRVVIDDRLITSRGPGTALEFSLTVIKILVSDEKYLAIKKDTLFT